MPIAAAVLGPSRRVSRSMQTISHVVLLFPQLASHTSTSGGQGQAWPRDESSGNVRCVNKQSAPFSRSVKCFSAIDEPVIFSFRCQERLEKCHNSLYGRDERLSLHCR